MSHSLYPFMNWLNIDCFHSWAIVNRTAVNMGMQISLWDPDFISFRCILRSEIAGSYSRSILNFLRSLHTVFCSGYTSLHCHWCRPVTHLLLKGSLFFIYSPVFIFYLFDNGCPDRYEMTSHCSLICISLLVGDVEHLFVYLLAICMHCLRNVSACL